MMRSTRQKALRAAVAAASCALAGYAGWSVMAWAAARGEEDDVAEARAGGGPEWIADYELGRQIARRTGRPLFVVFRCER